MENTKRYGQEPLVAGFKGIEVTIHWVRFVLPFHDPVIAMELIGIERSEFHYVQRHRLEGERTWSDYQHWYESRHGRIYFDPRGKQRILVEMTGQECEEFEAKCGPTEWIALIRRVNAARGKWRRIDLAADDKSGQVTHARVIGCLEANAFRMRFKSWGKRERHPGGTTIYLGSEGSSFFIRMYDKRQEIMSRLGHKSDGPWFRTEIQARAQYAASIARLIDQAGSLGIGAGIVKHYVTFLKPSKTDTNTSRWTEARWWGRWLADVEKVSISPQRKGGTMFATIERWLERQAGPAMALVLKERGRHALIAMAERSLPRLKAKHLKLIGNPQVDLMKAPDSA
ncbi:Replication initiation factor [compost metagenome]